jgi:hypothetical protein
MNSYYKETNIYDNLLIVMIVSLVSGYAGGVLFSLVHIVEIAVLPYFFSCKILFRKKLFFQLFLFAFAWLSYSVLSLMWAAGINRGFVTIIMFFFRFLMCFELLAFSMRARKPLESISKGWLIAVLMTSVVGLWEIITDHHLSIAREAELSVLGEIIQRSQASVLFYNPNTYSMFLVMAFPFLIYQLITGDKKRVTVAAIMLSSFIVIKNASRGSMLCVGMMVMMTLAFFMKRKKYRWYAIFSALALAGLVILFGRSLFSAFLLRMETQGMQDGARFEIWAGAWDVFLRSHGLGVGAGSMTAVLGKLNHYGIGYAHCLLLEALVEGGVFIAVLIVGFLCVLSKAALSESEKKVRIVMLLALIPFPVYSIINSEYLRPAFIWAFFMCIFLFSKQRKLDITGMRGA